MHGINNAIISNTSIKLSNRLAGAAPAVPTDAVYDGSEYLTFRTNLDGTGFEFASSTTSADGSTHSWRGSSNDLNDWPSTIARGSETDDVVNQNMLRILDPVLAEVTAYDYAEAEAPLTLALRVRTLKARG